MLRRTSEIAQQDAGADFVGRRERDEFREAAIAGLSQVVKSIPPRFLYDERGSSLFERICALPEYYLTRAETTILRRRAREIAELVGENAFLIELGSGASLKTRILLDALKAPAGYAPIDVSRAMLRDAAAAIALDYPQLRIAAVCADYAEEFPLPDIGSRRVGFFPGSTIGNLDLSGAATLLRSWRRRLGSTGLMVLGVDLKKNPSVIQAAYGDSAGVTKRFIKNILIRANRELGADFDLASFAYEARYRRDAGRVEMRLRSVRDQTVCVAGRRFSFAAGETIHIEDSHKYSPDELDQLAARSGFAPLARYVDGGDLFSVEVWAAS